MINKGFTISELIIKYNRVILKINIWLKWCALINKIHKNIIRIEILIFQDINII